MKKRILQYIQTYNEKFGKYVGAAMLGGALIAGSPVMQSCSKEKIIENPISNIQVNTFYDKYYHWSGEVRGDIGFNFKVGFVLRIDSAGTQIVKKDCLPGVDCENINFYPNNDLKWYMLNLQLPPELNPGVYDYYLTAFVIENNIRYLGNEVNMMGGK